MSFSKIVSSIFYRKRDKIMPIVSEETDRYSIKEWTSKEDSQVSSFNSVNDLNDSFESFNSVSSIHYIVPVYND